jgi:hypothetical protein
MRLRTASVRGSQPGWERSGGRKCGAPPNDMRISCTRSSYRPHKLLLSLSGHLEHRARLEHRPPRPVGCMRGLGGTVQLLLNKFPHVAVLR